MSRVERKKMPSEPGVNEMKREAHSLTKLGQRHVFKPLQNYVAQQHRAARNLKDHDIQQLTPGKKVPFVPSAMGKVTKKGLRRAA